ncbi:Crp/Fnr family transcriptional regulator [Rhizobium sp. YIM 134829]|uniref:Crp/Fnr family transcriptional regulator n=1 Tax=Rhizobium sp. YIM 134829 TaxID=3390453 RepID=UPI00397E6BAC
MKNTILKRLPRDAFDYLKPRLVPVALPVHYTLVEPRQPIEKIYFLESGLGSLVTRSPDGKSVEVRHVGYEGLSGYSTVLGVDHTPNKTFMQAAGHGLQVKVSTFKALLDHRGARELLLRYVHTCELQLAYSVLAAAKYTMYQRLARWLLMCHDRLEGDDLPITHDFLALMLGVRRSGVTEQLHILEGEHAIRSTRGSVRIVSRAKLLELAAGSYGVPEREYARLVDGFVYSE